MTDSKGELWAGRVPAHREKGADTQAVRSDGREGGARSSTGAVREEGALEFEVHTDQCEAHSVSM